MLNPNEAPAGYIAVERNCCSGCAFATCDCSKYTCNPGERRDGCAVQFHRISKREARIAQLEAEIENLKRLPVEPQVGFVYRIGGEDYVVASVKKDTFCLLHTTAWNRYTDVGDPRGIFGGDDDLFSFVGKWSDYVKSK